MIQNSNVLQQQRQAAARVRAMEERARRLVQEHPVNVYRGVTLTPATHTEPIRPDTPCDPQPPCPPPPPCAPACPTESKENGLSSLFGGDNERLLIVLLAVVLAKKGAPMELLLALLYVAL